MICLVCGRVEMCLCCSKIGSKTQIGLLMSNSMVNHLPCLYCGHLHLQLIFMQISCVVIFMCIRTEF